MLSRQMVAAGVSTVAGVLVFFGVDIDQVAIQIMSGKLLVL